MMLMIILVFIKIYRTALISDAVEITVLSVEE